MSLPRWLQRLLQSRVARRGAGAAAPEDRWNVRFIHRKGQNEKLYIIYFYLLCRHVYCIWYICIQYTYMCIYRHAQFCSVYFCVYVHTHVCICICGSYLRSICNCFYSQLVDYRPSQKLEKVCLKQVPKGSKR